jgi:hypothetical protein
MRLWHVNAILLALASAVSGCATSSGQLQAYTCKRPGGEFKLVGSPLRVAALDSVFGTNKDWQEFKARIGPDDIVVEFVDKEIHAEFRYEWYGYALVRGDCVIATITHSSISFG